MTLDLDPDRRLALAYTPVRARSALETLWRLDVSLASILVNGREPMISRIRLAWWRESLEKLDRERPPAEPLLQAIAAEILPAGPSGEQLARMTEGWDILLSLDPLTQAELAVHAELRGVGLFLASAQLLGGDLNGREGSARAWALVDLARHCGAQEAATALTEARTQPSPGRWPVPLRPLGMLARLARRDAESGVIPPRPQGSPSRMMAMLGHRLSGI